MRYKDGRIKKARNSGIIGSLILFLIGTLHLLKGHTGPCLILYSISSALFILAGFFTRLFIKITHLIGTLITQLLLALIFYLVFTPIGIIMRLLGKDPLDKNIDANRDSYWIKREEAAEDVIGYEKQF